MSIIMGWLGSSIDMNYFRKHFDLSRNTEIMHTGIAVMAFHDAENTETKLFHYHRSIAVCDGVLHDAGNIRSGLEWKYPFHTDISTELFLYLYEECGTALFSRFSGEYACIIYDGHSGKLVAARDKSGTYPLYYGFYKKGGIVFASCRECLAEICNSVHEFPAGNYYADSVLHPIAEDSRIRHHVLRRYV